MTAAPKPRAKRSATRPRGQGVLKSPGPKNEYYFSASDECAAMLQAMTDVRGGVRARGPVIEEAIRRFFAVDTLVPARKRKALAPGEGA